MMTTCCKEIEMASRPLFNHLGEGSMYNTGIITTFFTKFFLQLKSVKYVPSIPAHGCGGRA